MGWRSRLAGGLFLAGVACLDFSPLSAYRYLLISDILLLLALAAELGGRWHGRLYYPKFVGLLFLLYLLSTGLSFARALDPLSGLFTWLHSAFLMLVYVPIVTTMLVVRPDLRMPALVTLVLSVTAQAGVVGFAVLATGLDWTSGTRIAGAFGSVQFWPYLAASVGAVALIAAGSRQAKSAALCCLPVLVVAEMVFRSRMLWVGTIVGVCAFAVLQARRKALGAGVALSLCALFALGYVAGLYPAPIEARIASTIRPMESPDLVARMRVAFDVGELVAESPLVGVGAAQSAARLERLPVPPDIVNVHNILLHAAMEGGIGAALALALLPAGLLLLWIAGARAVQEPAGRTLLNWAFACLLAIYVGAQLTPTLYEHTFYFLMAFLASLTAAERAFGPGGGRRGAEGDLLAHDG
jgi:O-antigen ligase